MSSEADTEPYVLVTHRICVETRIPLAKYRGMSRQEISDLERGRIPADVLDAIDIDNAKLDTTISFISVQKRVH